MTFLVSCLVFTLNWSSSEQMCSVSLPSINKDSNSDISTSRWLIIFWLHLWISAALPDRPFMSQLKLNMFPVCDATPLPCNYMWVSWGGNSQQTWNTARCVWGVCGVCVCVCVCMYVSSSYEPGQVWTKTRLFFWNPERLNNLHSSKIRFELWSPTLQINPRYGGQRSGNPDNR